MDFVKKFLELYFIVYLVTDVKRVSKDEIVGRRLQYQRKKMGLSQKELAKQVSISTSYMNLIETGRRPAHGELLKRLSSVLNIKQSKLTDLPSAAAQSHLINIAKENNLGFNDFNELMMDGSPWMEILLQQSAMIQKFQQGIEEAAEKTSTDEKLASTVHDLLSRITSIRSTASILNTQGGIGLEQDAKFRQILHSESQEATKVAKELIATFDHTNMVYSKEAYAIRAAEQYFVRNAYEMAGFTLDKHLGWKGSVIEWGQRELGIDVMSAPLLQRCLVLFAQDQQFLPSKLFLEAFSEQPFDIEYLSFHFGVDRGRILRRIAQLSKFLETDKVTLHMYDTFGSVVLSPSLDTSLSNGKLACAKWPIFKNFQEGECIKGSYLKTSENAYYSAYAAASLLPDGIGNVTDERIKLMLVVEQNGNKKNTAVSENIEAEPAGFNCMSCHERSCKYRRYDAVCFSNSGRDE